MKVGMFQTPFQRPDRQARQVFDWAVEQAIEADQLGYSEYWIGEHATLNWESIPNPELVIAASARETTNIKFGPGAHLLPYFHPGSLAIQVGWLSQVLEGRYMLGVGAGAYPSDAALRGFSDLSHNHEMLEESLEIMNRIWKCEPFEYEGKFWKAGYPELDAEHSEWRSLAPYEGKLEIGMTALSEKSSSINYAGRHGYMPLSVFAGSAFLKQHWSDYEAAANEAGLKADRSVHHVVRDVFVAETDAEARRYAIEGGMGLAWNEYLLPTYKRFGIIEGMLEDPDMDLSEIGSEFLADHVWLVGSVDTVTEKLQAWSDEQGGFGTLLQYSHDYADEPEPWIESMKLLADEVIPRIKTPAAAAT